MYPRMMAGCLALISSMTSASAQSYRIQDLGTLGGATSTALDVNDRREVSGTSLVSSDPGSTGSLLRAFRYTSGTMTALTPLPGATTNRFARGYAINNAGVIVGEFDNEQSRAFVAHHGAMAGLTRLAGDTDHSVAQGINDAGTIVGTSWNGTASRPTRWTPVGTNYTPADLGTIAGTPASTGRALAINQRGTVVGMSENRSGVQQATLWDGGTVLSLGSLGEGTHRSQATAISDSGVVVGLSMTGGSVGDLIGTTSETRITRAFLWRDGQMSELPPLNRYGPGNTGATTNYHSEAHAINAAGLIVGNSQRVAGVAAVATLWRDGAPVDLNSLLPPGSGWTLLSAHGINAEGSIVGYGTIAGARHAFLLIPID